MTSFFIILKIQFFQPKAFFKIFRHNKEVDRATKEQEKIYASLRDYLDTPLVNKYLGQDEIEAYDLYQVNAIMISSLSEMNLTKLTIFKTEKKNHFLDKIMMLSSILRQLSHVDKKGNVSMVDISSKKFSNRSATAEYKNFSKKWKLIGVFF